MDVRKIAEAAKKFIGLHDFRNFAKKDESVFRPDDEDQNCMRRIYVFRI